KRSRQLATGGKEPKVAWENDKPTVVALREIASGLIDYDVIAQEEIVEDEPLFAAFEDEANNEALYNHAWSTSLGNRDPHRQQEVISCPVLKSSPTGCRPIWARTRSTWSAAPISTPSRPMTGSAGAVAKPTSPIPWRWPISSRKCTWTIRA